MRTSHLSTRPDLFGLPSSFTKVRTAHTLAGRRFSARAFRSRSCCSTVPDLERPVAIETIAGI